MHPPVAFHILRAPLIARLRRVVVSYKGAKLEPKKRPISGPQFHPISVGAPMTPILFRQAVGGRPGRLPITAAIPVARLSPDQSRPGRAALSEQKVQVDNITPPELFTGGFVDFLLGRGARHPR